MKTNKVYLFLRYFASFLLILFSVQYIPLESRAGVSWVKVVAMSIAPLVLLSYALRITKAFFLIILYLTWIWSISLINPITFRMSTILYTTLYYFMYLTFYNMLVYNKVFSFRYFENLITFLLMAYGICLIIQQIVLLLGIVKFPLINLCQVFNRGIGANSLSFEPSTAARTMVVLYLSLLRLFQIEHDRLPKVKELFYKYRWPSILFLWSMLTMGSGTAFVCLAILSLLFIKRQYVYSILPLLIVVYMTVSKIDYEPAQRAIKSIDAFLSLDKRNVINADYSAAARITPLLNTLNLDFFDYKSWIGQGSGFADGFSYSKLLNTAVVGRIHEYGIINFILMQILVYTCAIRRFCSMETLFWIFILGMTLNNVAYVWGIIMVMTVVSYFQQQKECNQLVFDEDEETKTEEYDLSLEPAAC